LAHARAVHADAIVMGTHGRGSFFDAVIGSVAGRVLASHFSVDCIAPALGRAFVARGRVVKAGRKQVFTAAELFGEAEDGTLKLVATGSTILVPVEDKG
ncbi:universal stress protein, partial [Variovorax sp.]|uniref:universal stress protein n=1 Tax=Variovorax sp. TaxID=1871043 RepID=UPI0025D44CAA